MAENKFIITVSGCEQLCGALDSVSPVRFQAVAKEAAKNIYNRSQAAGGTPVSTEKTRPGSPHGELRQSATVEVDGTSAIMGYTKEYAPHVEFGHRTRSGGYVAGQHYLQRNVDQEREPFKRRLIANLKKVF